MAAEPATPPIMLSSARRDGAVNWPTMGHSPGQWTRRQIRRRGCFYPSRETPIRACFRRFLLCDSVCTAQGLNRRRTYPATSGAKILLPKNAALCRRCVHETADMSGGFVRLADAWHGHRPTRETHHAPFPCRPVFLSFGSALARAGRRCRCAVVG